jgi:uncharacterized membrane protein YphA (DoxX/SURF4 family)
MKVPASIKSGILKTENDGKIIFIRLITGLIFISEGLQKFLIISVLGPSYFEEIGFVNPMFWSNFTATFELICGILILIGFLTRLASIPLLIIMITAFFTAKLPVLLTKGFLTFAHEYSLDFSLTLLLILLLVHGGGRCSADLKLSHNPATDNISKPKQNIKVNTFL